MVQQWLAQKLLDQDASIGATIAESTSDSHQIIGKTAKASDFIGIGSKFSYFGQSLAVIYTDPMTLSQDSE